MKKIFILLTLFVLTVSVKAQFPVNTGAGFPNTMNYQKGALGADSGMAFRYGFIDTARLNDGFLKGVPGLLIRVGDSLYMRGKALNRWMLINGGGATVTASNGLTKSVNDIKLGGTLTANTQVATSTFDLILGSSTNIQSWIRQNDGAFGYGSASSPLDYEGFRLDKTNARYYIGSGATGNGTGLTINDKTSEKNIHILASNGINTDSKLLVNDTMVIGGLVYANGSKGTSGQVLSSNGSGVDWITVTPGTGTVTSVATNTGSGITGGTITTTGTLAIDTAGVIATKSRLTNTAALKLNLTDTASMLTPYFREVGVGLLKSGHVVRADTAGVLVTKPFLANTISALTIPINKLTAATGTNNIDNTNLIQLWRWTTLAGDHALSLTSNSTAATGNAQNILNVQLSGANANSNQTTSAATITNGHTGTGATNYALKLQANGGANNYALQILDGSEGAGKVLTSDASGNATWATGSSVNIYNSDGTLNGNRAINLNGNNFLIKDGTDPFLSIDRSANEYKFGDVNGASDGTYYFADAANGTNRFYTSGTERLTIGNTGNVGIGNPSPTALLQVGDGSNTAGLLIDPNNTNTATLGDVSGGGASVKVDVGNLKTIIHRDLQLDSYGAGALTTDGSGNVTATSDRRVKHDIKVFTMGLREILKLSPSTFVYNQDKSNLVMPGFIAQDVQKAFGGMGVSHNKDGYLTLNTNVILAALVNSVREQQMQIEILKKALSLCPGAIEVKAKCVQIKHPKRLRT